MYTTYSGRIQPFILCDRTSFYYRQLASRNLKFPILGQIADVDGTVWDIRDTRATKHGFDLMFGSAANDHGAYNGGPPRLICTKELHDFWDHNRLKGNGFLFNLPAGRTTLKRLRRRFRFNFDRDTEKFWTDHKEDLKSLKPREFARKYNLNIEVVFDRRQKHVGRSAREIGWWRTPETIALLGSPLTLREIGLRLNISTSQVHRLRRRASAERAA
jgi:hypothetical protein